MISEYGMHITANRLKRQYDQLQGAEGEPVAIVDCYPEGDVVAVTGTYLASESDNTIRISTPNNGRASLPLDPGSELLVGYATIDAYVESALELFEADGNFYAGLVALSLIDKFPDHFPPATEGIAAEVARQIVTCSEYDAHLTARDSGDIIKGAVEDAMAHYIRSFPKALEALKDPVVAAYLAAWTDLEDEEAQLKLLVNIRS